MIHLDHNAGAPLDPRVGAAMAALLEPEAAPGNPSSIHRRGRAAREVVEEARRRVAEAVGAEALGITFTSGGTEADNLALFGVARARRGAGKAHGVATSRLEHPAVVEAVEQLAREGHPVAWIPVDGLGRVDSDDVATIVREHPEIGIVSVAAANHELGNTYDVAAIAAAVRHSRPDIVVHCDAVQALGKVAVRFDAWGVDLMALSAHKVGGPAGVGALVHHRFVDLQPLWRGGHQERGRRPGTESALTICGFGVAAQLAEREREARQPEVNALRQRLAQGLEQIGAEVLGDPDHHVGNTVCAALPGCSGELVCIALDLVGIAVSTGAACTIGSLEPSPVIRALGLPGPRAGEVVRFSLGRGNTTQEVDAALAALPPILDQIRGAA